MIAQTICGTAFLIDDEVYFKVCHCRFHLKKHRNTNYVECYYKGISVKLHRFILGFDDPKLIVDHIDRNGLNNQLSNLRIANHSDNQKNKKPRGRSHFIGVSWHKCRNKWISHINIDGKVKHLGLFENEIDAALAYNAAAILTGNKFYNINVIK